MTARKSLMSDLSTWPRSYARVNIDHVSMDTAIVDTITEAIDVGEITKIVTYPIVTRKLPILNKPLTFKRLKEDKSC